MATGPQTGTLVTQPSLSPQNETRIAIIDDHAIVREGLARLIRHDIELAVCGLFEGSTNVLESVAAFQPEMVIVEIALNTIDGIALIKSIRTQFPQMPILVLSLQEECFYAERALRAGASGYIMKRETSHGLMCAISSVLKGNLYLSQKMSALVLTKYLNGRTKTKDAGSPQTSLSNRELEIFELIGQGHRTRTIAESLQLSTKTVETHRAHIMEKLNLRNSIELLQRAMQWTELRQ
jgi:DNA-binding NarL/FixJ family response regulator